MEPGQILALLDSGGLVALLVIIIAGGARRWWVWGWHYDELKLDRDEWKELALSGTALAETALDVAEPRKRRKTGGDER